MIQKLIFDKASIPQFRSAKTAPISNRGLFLHRLRLIKILGAGFVKNQLLNHVGYMRFYYIAFTFLAQISLTALTPHAYITNQGNGTVTVVNVINNTISTIAGFTHTLRVVAVTPNGLYAYVGSDDGLLRIIDTTTNVVLPIVIDVAGASALAISPNGNYVYATGHNNIVNVVSTATNTVVASVTGFNRPQDIAITLDSAYAYITDFGSSSVIVVRTSDNMIVDTITGFNEPLGISISPNGLYAYVTDIGNGTVSVIRLLDNTVTNVISGFGSPRYAASTPNGTYLFVSDLTNGEVAVAQTSDYMVIDSFPVNRPSSLAFTPDGAYVYVASALLAVSKFRTSDYALLLTIPNLDAPSNIAMALTDPIVNSIVGFQSKDCILLQTDLYNKLSWSASVGAPVAYLIFRDSTLSDLAGQVGGGTLTFIDHNRQKNLPYTYYVMALYANGFSSSVGTVEVFP